MNAQIFEKPFNSRLGLLILFALMLLLFFEFPVVELPIIKFTATDAEARVGRPATPGSVAGVHRRTRRRVARRVAVGTRVYTLPTSCATVVIGGVKYNKCGEDYYRPYYEGDKVVYVVEEPK